LLAQTITLDLNMRLDADLDDMVFQTGNFFTRESTDCNNPAAQPILGTEMYYTMPAGIMGMYGGQPSVMDIYTLANNALGGVNVGCGMDEISEALGVINDALDECKFIYFTGAPVTAPTQSTTNATHTKLSSFEPEAIVNIAPNPFQHTTQIRYMLNTDSRVTLEVYNLQGVKIATIFEGDAKAGFDYTYRFDPVGNNSEQVFLVVLRTNFGTITKRIINTY
jgi:hypothetical protein